MYYEFTYKYPIFFLNVLFCFAYTYNLSFKFWPAASTGRIVIIILFLLNFKEVALQLPRFAKRIQWYLLIYLFLVIYALLLFYFSGNLDKTIITRFINFFLYVVIGSFIFNIHFNYNKSAIAISFFSAIFIQTLFIFFSYGNLEFKLFLDRLLVQGGHIEFTSMMRSSGFSNGSGSNLSVIQSFGILFAALLVREEKYLYYRIVYIVGSILIVASNMLVGRVGLMLSAIFFCMMSIINNKRQLLFIIIFTSCFLYTFSENFINFLSNNIETGYYEAIVKWNKDIYNIFESESVISLNTMTIPPLNIDTLLGTGLISDEYSLNASGHDSGYIQTYYGYGIVIAIIFYTTFLFYIYRINNCNFRNIIILLPVIIMYLIEWKEPFMFKYILPFIIVTLQLRKQDCSKLISYKTQ